MPPHGMSHRRLGSEIAWKPALMLMVYAIICIPIGGMFWQQDDVKNDEIKTQGKVIDVITEDQEEYFGSDDSSFPEPSFDGRVTLLLSHP